MVKTNSPFLIAILVMLAPLCAMGAIMLAPALSHIAFTFDITPSLSGQAMTTYLFGYALGQAFYGALSDQIGRKMAMVVGILMSLMGLFCSFAATYSGAFNLFLLGRFLTALGTSSTFVVCFLITKDLFDGPHERRVISYMIASFALMPAIGGALGGWLESQVGWVKILPVFGLICLFMLGLVLLLPETCSREKRVKHSFTEVASIYLNLAGLRPIMLSGLLFGGCMSLIYLYSQLVPLLASEILGLDAKTFGLFNMLPYFGMFVGAITSAVLATTRRPHEVIVSGFASIALGVVILFIVMLAGRYSILGVEIPMFFVFVGASMIVPNIARMGTQFLSDESRALATSLINFLGFFTAVIAMMLAGFLSTPHLFVELPIIYLFLGMGMVGVFSMLQLTRTEILFKETQ